MTKCHRLYRFVGIQRSIVSACALHLLSVHVPCVLTTSVLILKSDYVIFKGGLLQLRIILYDIKFDLKRRYVHHVNVTV